MPSVVAHARKSAGPGVSGLGITLRSRANSGITRTTRGSAWGDNRQPGIAGKRDWAIVSVISQLSGKVQRTSGWCFGGELDSLWLSCQDGKVNRMRLVGKLQVKVNGRDFIHR